MQVEIVGGADEGEVGEGLGEIAEVFAAGSEFFGVEAEMIGVAEGFIEEEPGFLKVAGAGDALDVPEGAHGEGAFVAAEPVVGGLLRIVAEDERILGEDLFDAAEGEEPAGVVGWDEFEERHEEGGCIDGEAAFVLDERLEGGIPEMGMDIVMDGGANGFPAVEGSWEGTFEGEPDAAIDGDPAHEA